MLAAEAGQRERVALPSPECMLERPDGVFGRHKPPEALQTRGLAMRHYGHKVVTIGA
jgi:hypothetical protein